MVAVHKKIVAQIIKVNVRSLSHLPSKRSQMTRSRDLLPEVPTLTLLTQMVNKLTDLRKSGALKKLPDIYVRDLLEQLLHLPEKILIHHHLVQFLHHHLLQLALHEV